MAYGDNGQHHPLGHIDIGSIGRADIDIFDDVLGSADRIHGAFGKTRGSGSVSEVENILFLLIHIGGFISWFSGNEVLVIYKACRRLVHGADDDDIFFFDVRKMVRIDISKKFHTHEETDRIRIVDHILHFRRNEPEIYGNRNDIGAGQSVINFQKLDVVVHDDRYFFLPLEPFLQDRVGQLIGPGVEFFVGDPFVLENSAHLIRVSPGTDSQAVG